MQTLYVSTEGNDQWDGSCPKPQKEGTGPLATLSRARDLARALRTHAPDQPITLQLAGGHYSIDESIVFTEQDSGTREAPLIIRGDRELPTRLLGGRAIKTFRKVADEEARSLGFQRDGLDAIRVCDLAAQGMTSYGSYIARGFYQNGNGAMELFCQGVPMTVARYPKASPLPNRDFLNITSVDDGVIHYNDPQTRHWVPRPSIVVNGYWQENWATRISHLKAFDPAKGSFRLTETIGECLCPSKGGRFFFFNVPEALNDPGEYLIDREQGKLYVIPPEGCGDDAEWLVSCLASPIIETDQANYLRFENLTIEAGQSDGMRLQGGEGIEVVGCHIRNVGRDGIVLQAGQRHAILSCDIYQTGMSGISITGDTETGTDCGHRIHNCHLHHIAREGKTYFAAINIEFSAKRNARGVEITHNRLHDHPHSLLFFWGNDHLIAFNEFYNFTLEGDDCGCCYAGRDFSFQGNRIEHNFFHHAGDSGNAQWGSSGVYLDDGAGGTQIHHNLFLLVNRSVQAGGGVNTVIRNNVFVHCHPSVWFDERCASARADRGSQMVHGLMKQRFETAEGFTKAFQARYPNMDCVAASLENGCGVLTWGGELQHNRILGPQDWLSSAWATIPSYVAMSDNATEPPPPIDSVSTWEGLQQTLGEDTMNALFPEPPGLIRDEHRPLLEDVGSAIEVLTPPSTNGTPGKACLRLFNQGDTTVKGKEWIEIKCQRHGPGKDAVKVAYEVAPGERKDIAFDLPLPCDITPDVFELWICSRGSRIRPAWNRVDIACGVTTEWQYRDEVTQGHVHRDGKAMLHLRTVDPSLVSSAVALHMEPEAIATLDHPPLTPSTSEDGLFTAEINIHPSPKAEPQPHLHLRAEGKGVRPAALSLPITYSLPTLPSTGDREARARILDQGPWFPVQRTTRVGCKHGPNDRVAEVALGMTDETLMLRINVQDPSPTVTDLLWDGSCVELFTASPEQRRLQAVFGAMDIGHLFFVPPATADEPAMTWRFKDNQYHKEATILPIVERHPTHYTLTVDVPFEALALPPNTTRFLAEVQVSVAPDETLHPAGRRATLFGSSLAYQDTSFYGLFSKTDMA